ncbi:NfeD family protein [Virgibacillus sp. W0430]|uniref:NfeD family protein n=1 Tax=Virgibacillus sp. W0430 TaxID=3391580 RepID=UPI003F46EDF1
MVLPIVDAGWVLFLITFFGTMFLIGEILVNMRGIFGLLGIGLITFYFYGNIVEPSTFILMLIVYFIGLLLIIADGKLINDGTLATLGLACMLLATALAAQNISSGLYAVIGVLLGSGCAFFFLKMFKRRNMWEKIALKDRLTKDKGYSSMNKEYEGLVGLHGETLTDLRPVGTISINGQDFSGISNAQWIEKGSKIVVVKVDGTRILVKKLEP